MHWRGDSLCRSHSAKREFDLCLVFVSQILSGFAFGFLSSLHVRDPSKHQRTGRVDMPACLQSIPVQSLWPSVWSVHDPAPGLPFFDSVKAVGMLVFGFLCTQETLPPPLVNRNHL